MTSFVDNTGKSWTIFITAWSARRVLAETKVDLFALVEDNFAGLANLMAHPLELIEIVYHLCADQVAERRMEPEDFFKAVYGDVFQVAMEAFTDELINFFPNPRYREAIRKVVGAHRRVTERMFELQTVRAGEIDVDSLVERFASSYTSSPASSGSTPAPSPSANST